jgi:hypothetical protein
MAIAYFIVLYLHPHFIRIVRPKMSSSIFAHDSIHFPTISFFIRVENAQNATPSLHLAKTPHYHS